MEIVRKKKTIIQLLILLFFTVTIPLTILLVRTEQEFRSKAVARPVVLTVDLAQAKPLPRIWQNLAQGGETPIPQLSPVTAQLRELAPTYIRIDHVFDAYQTARSDGNGNLVYDFSLLDKEIDAILAAGAKPFLSLSYIPPDLIDPLNSERPISYTMWQELVAKTIFRYSGKQNKNIPDVFYEVYNEPDLFGKWSVDEYTKLYEASIQGAQSLSGTNNFAIGGPALSYFDGTFIDTFLTNVQEKNLRLDFISWHTYSPNPLKISQDSVALSLLLSNKSLPKTPLSVVSEWGSYPQKHIWHDSDVDSSHLIATVSRSLDFVDMLFYFEVKDGDSSNEAGGWGILRNGSHGFAKKPRFYAVSLLNSLGSSRYVVSGASENIYALAGGNSATEMALLVANYSFGRSGGIFPIDVRFINILPGAYNVSKVILRDNNLSEEQSQLLINSKEGGLGLELFPDSIAFLRIVRASAALATVAGESGLESDRAGQLIASGAPLIYPLPLRLDIKVEKISFSMKPQQSLYNSSNSAYFLSEGKNSSIRLNSDVSGFTGNFILTVSDGLQTSSVSLPLSAGDWQRWHKVEILLDRNRFLLSLSFDGTIAQGSLRGSAFLGNTVVFGKGFEGAMDTIHIAQDQETLLVDDF